MSSLSNVCEKYNVFKQAVVSLDWSEAYAILKNFKPDSTPYINSPIVKPKGGDVYIYFTTDELKEDDYKVDYYQWRNNGAKKPTPYNDPVMYKSYFLAYKHDKTTSKNH